MRYLFSPYLLSAQKPLDYQRGRDMKKPTITILSSWFSDVARGSGTARSINSLVAGLRRRGFGVQLLGAERTSDPHQRRIRFNARLAQQPQLVGGDLVFGFDADGYRWAVQRDRFVPYLVFVKGMRADEARFERGGVKKELLLEAQWERQNCQLADRVVTTSRYLKQQLIRQYGLPADKVTIIPECIALRDWQAQPSKPHRTTVGILTVARMYPRKNIELLLRAARSLVQRHRVSFDLVGGGPQWPLIQQRVRQWRLQSFVSLHKEITDQQLRQRYRQADVFCLPSRQEGFGIVFLEAMAAGVPVVALAAGAVPEVVGDAGLLVGNSVRELRAGLECLITDAALRQRLGARAKQRVKRFDERRVFQRYRTLIQRYTP